MSGLATRSARTAGAAHARFGLQHSFKKFLLVATTALLAACGPEADITLESLASPKPPVPAANVSGRVADSSTGADIVGATVSMEAAPVETVTGTTYPPPITDTSDANGLFDLVAVKASSTALMHVSAPGYMDAYVVVNAVGGYTAQVLVELLPVAASGSFDPAVGGSVAVAGSTAEVTVPAGSLQLPGGGAPTSPVTVNITPINMSQELSATPGDFTNATSQPLEGRGGVSVSATDATGAAVELATGQTVTVRIPYTSRNTGAAPATVALYAFDTATGKWADAAVTATLGGIAPDQYYEASVGTLGTFMAGEVISPTSTITGCVANEVGGARVANVRVQAEGIDYSGISYGTTDAAGNFSVTVKAGANLIINGGLGNYLTNTVSQPASSTAGTSVALPECLTLAALSGTPRITLTWGDLPNDLDSHLFAPDGTHVRWNNKGNLAADPYAALDVDDTTGYGPEVTTLRRLMVGTYTYGVRNFSGTDTPGITNSPALVELRRGLEVQRYRPGAGETATDDWWVVFEFTVDAQCNITVTDRNLFFPGGETGPTGYALPASVELQYCVPAAP